MHKLRSCLCTQAQLESPTFRQWTARLGERVGRLHRKVWEWCYIAQAFHERGMLAPARHGLGFAVGREPLVSLFAGLGCRITATDQEAQRAADAGWVKTRQHTTDLATLNEKGLCDADSFRRRVEFRRVDMNRIPRDLRGFDFLWSACSLEHLGSLAHGEQFIYNALRCLKVGGVAVHTTEFTLSSNLPPVDHHSTVLFRHCDIERIVGQLTASGHAVEPFLNDTGDLPVDRIVDAPPFGDDNHLKLLLRKEYTCTSVGLIITKTSDSIPRAPSSVTPRTLRVRLRPATQWLTHRLRRAKRRAGFGRRGG